MEVDRLDYLSRTLPESARRYMEALATNDLLAEEHDRIAICSIIERLLGSHLKGITGWDPGSWVDGVLPGTFKISDSGVVEVIGLVVWWSRNSDCFLDPVAAQVRLSYDRKLVRGYSLYFGDATAGLGKFPYQLHTKERYRPPPEEWCCVFEQGVR